MPLRLEFAGPVWFWRGPAPWYFVTVPDAEAGMIEATSGLVSYGWGMIPVTVELGRSRWTTSLWPKDGGYIVPIRSAERRAERVELDDVVELALTIGT